MGGTFAVTSPDEGVDGVIQMDDDYLPFLGMSFPE
jgi:hypothetical protein